MPTSRGGRWKLRTSPASTGGSGVIEKLAASVQAGDPPDLVMHDQLAATQMENLGLVEPADDQVAAVEAVFGKAAPYINQIGRVNDAWQYLPYHQRSDGGWYQAPAFEEAGIDLQAIRTYEDLFEATLAVSKPEEELYGWGTTVNRSGDGNFFINRVKTGYGAGWQDETGEYIATNSPEMIEAMNLIKAVYTDEKYAPMLPPGVLAWGDISNNEAYLGGILAYTTEWRHRLRQGACRRQPDCRNHQLPQAAGRSCQPGIYVHGFDELVLHEGRQESGGCKPDGGRFHI